jgi:tryptophan-rich sensory protein
MARKKHDETKQAVRFAWILLFLLGALAGFSAWREHWIRCGIVATLAVLAPALAHLARPVWMAFFARWMKFAEVLGMISTTIILSIFFYVFLTPVGLVARMVRKDPLDLNWKHRRATYWIDREPVEPTLERYEKQF